MAEENRLFQVEIITPDRIFYTGEGDMIEFTTASGEIGVYKKHIPLTTVLAPGIVMSACPIILAMLPMGMSSLSIKTPNVCRTRGRVSFRQAGYTG